MQKKNALINIEDNKIETYPKTIFMWHLEFCMDTNNVENERIVWEGSNTKGKRKKKNKKN